MNEGDRPLTTLTLRPPRAGTLAAFPADAQAAGLALGQLFLRQEVRA